MSGFKKMNEVSVLKRGAGSIARKPGSNYLYFSDFQYLGKRVEISTGMTDTPENWEKAAVRLISLRERMQRGSFRFSEEFPGASPRIIALFAAKEEASITVKPQDVNFGEYVPKWYMDVWAHYHSETKKTDQKFAIDHRIAPFFSGMSFSEINSNTVGEFIRSLKKKKGERQGEQLSRERIVGVLRPLRAIWRDACDEYRWELPDPFRKILNQLPQHETLAEGLDKEGAMPAIGSVLR